MHVIIAEGIWNMDHGQIRDGALRPQQPTRLVVNTLVDVPSDPSAERCRKTQRRGLQNRTARDRTRDDETDSLRPAA